jgi:hypothetical protein
MEAARLRLAFNLLVGEMIFPCRVGMPSVLECQSCGEILRQLSHSEAQMVADNPYNYVVWCAQCKRDGAHLGRI